MVNLLLEFNANVDRPDSYDDFHDDADAIPHGPILFAAAKVGNMDIVQSLLQAGATSLGHALVGAAAAGHHYLVKFLLESNADIESRDHFDNTALLASAEHRRVLVVSLLLERRAEVGAVSGCRASMLMQAARGYNVPLLQWQLSMGFGEVNAEDNYAYTALTHAAASGGTGCIATLLDAGAAVDGAGHGFVSPAGRGEITPLIAALKAGHDAAALDLVKAGADLWRRDRDGTSVLAYAVMGACGGTLRRLLDARADVNALENDRASPLSYAADRRVAQMLIDAKAEVNPPRGESVLRAACRGHRLDTLELLLRAGADVHRSTFSSPLAEALGYPRDDDADDASVSAGGESPITATVRALLAAGARVSTPAARGGAQDWSALHRAARMRCKRPNLMHPSVPRAVELMLAADPGSVDVRGDDGETALMLAAEHANVALMQVLLRAGADVDAADSVSRRTPLMYSRSAEATDLLIAGGADLDARDATGRSTALYAAAAVGSEVSLYSADLHAMEAVLRSLVGAGADVSTVGDGGVSVLTALFTVCHQEVSRDLSTITETDRVFDNRTAELIHLVCKACLSPE
jgi:ankyrin repeat protein